MRHDRLLVMFSLFSWARDRARLFLWGVLGLECVLLGWLTWGQRVPRIHDTFQYWALQYFYLNHVAEQGSTPLWIPYMTQGVPANWVWTLGAGWLLDALSWGGGWWKSVGFPTLFYGGIGVDHLVLLVGTWCLTGLYYRRWASRAVVLAAVGGGAIWMNQIWFNFHFYTALPLALWLGHRFLQEGGYRWFFLCGNLMAMQMAGNLPYMLPVQTWIVSLYFIFFLTSQRGWREAWKKLSRSWIRLGGAMVGVGLSFGVIYVVLRQGTEEIVNFNPGRMADGTAPLVTFLSYGSNMSVKMAGEMLLRISPGLDYTLYSGMGTVALALLALIEGRGKMRWVLAGMVLLLTVFSMGGYVASWVYGTWPMMKYYRHLTSVLVIAKIFLCFLAGFGFDALLERRYRTRWIAGILAFALLAWGMGLWMSRNNLGEIRDLLQGWTRGLSVAGGNLGEDLSWQLGQAAGMALAWGALFLFMAIMRRPSTWIVGGMVTLQILDVYGYKAQQIILDTESMDASAFWRLHDFRPLPYVARRGESREAAERRRDLEPFYDSERAGVFSWIQNVQLFDDRPDADMRTDYWMRPLDDWLRAMAPDHENAEKRSASLLFRPMKRWSSARKLGGLDRDKLQVFEGAYTLKDLSTQGTVHGSTEYGGDLLFVSKGSGEATPPSVAPIWEGQPHLKASSRVATARCSMREFGANRVMIEVDTGPMTRNDRAYWLLYADGWHPFWRAKIQGQPAEIYRGAMAYKAVRIPAGKSEVEMEFHAPWLVFCLGWVEIQATCWILGTLVLGLREKKDLLLEETMSRDSRKGWYGMIAGALVVGSVMVSTDKNTWLLVASGQGHLRVTRWLLDQGADPNFPTKGGMTPLEFAAMRGHEAVFKELLSRGADPEILDQDGMTIWGRAGDHGYEKITRWTLEAIAERPKNVNRRDVFGRTCLQSAVYWCDAETVRKLLNHGAKTEEEDMSGQTALRIAAFYGRAEVVEELCRHGAVVDRPGEDGYTALMIAAYRGHRPIVESLLKRRANVEARNVAGRTALILALMGNHSDVIARLLDVGANPNSADQRGRTPLMYAVEGEDLAMLRLLIHHGANLNATMEGGTTALMIAASLGRERWVRVLLERGANPSLQDEKGRTAFDWAMGSRHPETLQILKKALEEKNSLDKKARRA